MSQTLADNWKTILGTSAAVALVFGISWLLFSADSEQLVPDPDPEVIERDTFDVNRGGQPAGAGTPQGPVVISPATISIQNAAPGLQLPPINVQNQSSEPRKVQIDFAPFYRTNSQGVPVILSDAENVARGQRYLQVKPQGPVTIPANSSLEIQSTLRAAPPQPTLMGSIGVTLLGASSPLSAPERDGVRTRVQQNIRLSALLYAVFPGGSSERFQVESLQAEDQGAPGSLRLTVELRSAGDLPTEAQGRVFIRNQDSGQVLSKQLPAVTILPGQRATSSSEPFSDLQPGRYRISARVDNGRSGQQLSRSLLIDKRGFPAVPRVTARLDINTGQARPGADIELRLRVKNSGQRAFTPQTKIAVYQTASSRAQASQRVDLPNLQPGQQEDKSLTLQAPQSPGGYVYTATIANQTGEVLEERSVGLVVSRQQTTEISLSDKFRDWLSDNPGAGLALGSLATGMVLLFILVALQLRAWWRQRG